MRERSWRLLTEAMLAAAILVVGLRVFGGAADRVSFHGDEGMHISTARYFEYLFVQHDLTRPEWGDNYWTHTQPRIMSYILGSWLWSRGYDLDALPPAYDASKSLEENRQQGRVPDETLLIQARTPMVGLATGAVALLYLLGRAVGGVAAGLVAALLALASPVAQTYLVRAVPDAALAFFLLLTLLLGVLGARRGRDGGLPLGWAIALGVALGLGLGNKLTAVLSLATVLAWGILVAIVTAIRRADVARRTTDAQASSAARSAWAAARGWALSLVVAVALFVVTDPHLYPHPFLHTAHLFNHRAQESAGLQRVNPHLAIHSPVDRAGFVLRESLIGGMPAGSRGAPLEAALATVGGAAVLAGAWRNWRATGRLPAESLVLLTALTYVTGLSAFLNLALSRYVVPTLLISILFSGLGISVLGRQLSAITLGPKRRELAGQGTAPRL